MPNIMNALINTGVASNTMSKQEKLIDFNMFMLKGFSQAKPNNLNISVNVSPNNNVKQPYALNIAVVDKSKQADLLNISVVDKNKTIDFLNLSMVDKSNQSNTYVNLIATNDVLSFYNLSHVTLAQTKTENVIEANTMKVNTSNKDIFNTLTVNTLDNTSQLFDNVQEGVSRTVKIVQWQGMSTGYLSQIDSLTNYQLNIPQSNNLQNVNSSKISHLAMNHSLLNGVIMNVPHENSFFVIGSFNRSKSNAINQKKSTDFVSYKTANIVNTEQILSQKMTLTFSNEMKKLWIRDYFEEDNLTLKQSEQLLNKLNLFGPQKFDQIAVNGKVLWHSSDNKWSLNNSKES